MFELPPVQVLLFSTMTAALDVVGRFLEWRGFEHLLLDGRTRPADRGGIVDCFNNTGRSLSNRFSPCSAVLATVSIMPHALPITPCADAAQGCSSSCSACEVRVDMLKCATGAVRSMLS